VRLVVPKEKKQKVVMSCRDLEPTGSHSDDVGLDSCFGITARSGDYFRVKLVRLSKKPARMTRKVTRMSVRDCTINWQ
jgi:hypothetical protein